MTASRKRVVLPDGIAGAVWRASPNFTDRRGFTVDMVLIHYTGMISADASLARLCADDSGVSAHYLIDEAGQIIQMVDEAHRAWHAGMSFWAGETDINSLSIGIELQNPGHELGYRPFPETQMVALMDVLDGIRARHSIPSHRVLAHSDVAPQRKEDPGELFPWPRFAARGHGYWRDEDASALPTEDVLGCLRRIGYQTETTEGDPVSRAALLAFQRHFLPDHLSGEPDIRTRSRLADVADHWPLTNGE